VASASTSASCRLPLLPPLPLPPLPLPPLPLLPLLPLLPGVAPVLRGARRSRPPSRPLLSSVR
jgi:hypothetical protein